MRAAVLYTPGDIRIEDVAAPELRPAHKQSPPNGGLYRVVKTPSYKLMITIKLFVLEQITHV